jgi:phage terminase large subunit
MQFDENYLKSLPRAELEKIYAKYALANLKQIRQERQERIANLTGYRKYIYDQETFFKQLAKDIPAKFTEQGNSILEPHTFKFASGGRGAAKSLSFAKALVAYAVTQHERILCAREFQTSIKDSVHQDIKSQIDQMGLSEEFEITQTSIRCPRTDSEFFFKGLKLDPNSIRSIAGITKTWLEEAHTVSKESLQILLPSVLRDSEGKSELWASYNPENEDDAIEAFANSKPNNMVRIYVNWNDNPWFPPLLEELRKKEEERARQDNDWSAYNWTWQGRYRTLSEAVIFWRRVVVEDFTTPEDVRWYHGVDWGFANDPTALVRCYITIEENEKHLWIDDEAYGYRVDLDELPALFRQIPTSRRWPIRADSARPETISYMRKQGYNITAAEKWHGSIEDGIAHMKSYAKIHVHACKCPNIINEFKLYSYKSDKRSDPPIILPVPIDAYCDGLDATRYSLDLEIRNQAPMNIRATTLQKLNRRNLRLVGR